MKKTFALLTALGMLLTAAAKPVSIDSLSQVATLFFPGQKLDQAIDLDGIYLFRPASGKGFVLLAGDDCVRPVLAYSTDGTFPTDTIPTHVQSWLNGYRQEIASIKKAGIGASDRVRALWSNPMPRKSDNSVPPLMSTRWGQEPLYNDLCPYDSTVQGRSVTGCVATAMAQIMRYWQHPTTGWSSHSYRYNPYGFLSADFENTTYQWSLMPDTLNALCDSAEIMAVATLMYHAGVAVEMRYSPEGSGAMTTSNNHLDYHCAENALKTYFRYNPLLSGKVKARFSDSQWITMLRNDLDANRPILYSGSDREAGGHAFVIDGYDTTGMFHINWGWRGHYNAYYTIDSLAPNEVYIFENRNAAIFNVFPAQPITDSIVTVNFVSNDTALGTVLGNGTYHPYDTVTIMMQAAEGCLFVNTAHGFNSLPISFLASQNISDTAFFERITGDTISYCEDLPTTYWSDDYGNTTQWGIRIPASLRHARQLSAVEFYCITDGDHILNIYTGDSINDATPIYTHTYNMDNAYEWQTLILDSILTFHRNEIVWITLSYTNPEHTYAIGCANFCGNSDGSWYHLPWGWQPYNELGVHYTWMLNAIMLPNEQYSVAATPNFVQYGDVSGMGSYYPGDTVTLIATPKPRCTFLNWSTGSNANPLVFVITRDTAIIAYFEPLDGIEEANLDGIRIKTQGLTVTVENPEQRNVELFDITGRQLSVLRSPLSTFHFPTPGVYLLKAEGLPARRIVVMNHQ